MQIAQTDVHIDFFFNFLGDKIINCYRHNCEWLLSAHQKAKNKIIRTLFMFKLEI